MASSSGSTRPVLDEFYRIAFRKKIYGSIADLQVDLDQLGPKLQWRKGRTKDDGASAKRRCRPSLDATPLAKEKMIAA